MRTNVLLSCIVVLAVTMAAVESRAADDTGYRTPPRAVADILAAPNTPRGAPNVSPDLRRLALPEYPSLMSIADLSEPVEKLAGLEVLQGWYCTRAQIKGALSGLTIRALDGNAKVKAKLPAGARIGAVNWSLQGDRLACALYAHGGAELWIVNAATGEARRAEGVKLNTVLLTMLAWSNDGRSLLCATVPGAVDAPAVSRVPTGPRVRTGAGKPTPQRTSREVLRTEADQQRFRDVASSRLARVELGGTGTESGLVASAVRPVGAAGVLYSVLVSPDEQHLAVESGSDFPIGFPYSLFPRELDVWSAAGERVVAVGKSPLNDRSAISSVERLGPRQPMWAIDGSTLWFMSWEDRPGAKFADAIRDTTLPPPGKDRLLRLDKPFTQAPVAVTTSEFPMQGMTWAADGRVLLVSDNYDPRRIVRLWWMDPARPDAHTVLYWRSFESGYGHPGTPVLKHDRQMKTAWTTADGKAIYMAGAGYRPDGQRPFLDRMDLATARSTRRFESSGDVLEYVGALVAEDGSRFVTLQQTSRTPPNYFLRKAGSKTATKLSDYPHPSPALEGIQRIPFTFVRPDNVKLNAEAVLPADWKPGRALPTVFWVYPSDYRSAAAASEVRRSPHRFPSKSPLNPEVLVTQGYAVIYPDLAIVGKNEQYVQDLGVSARAALDEAVRRGFTDRDRVGVGGHSYGAFATANLLAHTDLFRAGIASDGAYNRTLTPFTFQTEERNLWEARDVYLDMSPFLSANKINEPLLLLHNLDDTNVGTHPMQSERMYEALNGLGKKVTLIEYPYEDHGPAAKETVFDYWARVIEWYDRYVKSAPAGATVAAPGAPAVP